MTYHHGDLRRTLLDETAAMVAEVGVAHFSMRAVAKRAGVSNAAPTHHFRDKTGLLTALAAEGFGLLADALESDGGDPDLVDRGVAYVAFALEHPSHFAVMFQPDLLDSEDAELRSARHRALQALVEGVEGSADLSERPGDSEAAQVAAWSLVHGYATLVLSGAVNPSDPLTFARSVALMLVPGRSPSGRRTAENSTAETSASGSSTAGDSARKPAADSQPAS